MFVAGPAGKSKETVMLVRDVGFDVADAGDLAHS